MQTENHREDSILLISPITSRSAGVATIGAPSMGLYRISFYVERHTGATSRVISSDLHPEQLEGIDFKQYKIVGISVLHDTMINTVAYINSHDFGDAILIIGGPESAMGYQDFLDRCPRINAVCLAEGERVMRHLITEGLTPYPGMIIRTLAKPIDNADMWEFCEPMDFSRMDFEDYWKRNDEKIDSSKVLKTIRLMTISHCARRCTFCNLNAFHTRACGKQVAPAFLSAEQIEVQFKKILQKWPDLKTMYLIDDDTFVNAVRNEALVDLLARYPFKYIIQTLTNRLTPEFIVKLSRAGVIKLIVGVESPIARIRRDFGKPQDDERIDSMIESCLNNGITPYFLLILFPPEITIAEFREGVKILRRWKDRGVELSIEPWVNPFRGSQLYDSDLDMEYKIIKVGKHEQLRKPYVILPKDLEVRALMQKFRLEWPEYLKAENVKLGLDVSSKAHSSPLMIDYLEGVLK